MTVTISLPAKTEQVLREKAARLGQTLEAYLERLAVESAASATAAERPPQEWVAEWRAWAASHRTLPHLADDSRESIYAGRGQ
jgi:hypothetical protein